MLSIEITYYLKHKHFFQELHLYESLRKRIRQENAKINITESVSGKSSDSNMHVICWTYDNNYPVREEYVLKQPIGHLQHNECVIRVYMIIGSTIWLFYLNGQFCVYFGINFSEWYMYDTQQL